MINEEQTELLRQLIEYLSTKNVNEITLGMYWDADEYHDHWDVEVTYTNNNNTDFFVEVAELFDENTPDKLRDQWYNATLMDIFRETGKYVIDVPNKRIYRKSDLYYPEQTLIEEETESIQYKLNDDGVFVGPTYVNGADGLYKIRAIADVESYEYRRWIAGYYGFFGTAVIAASEREKYKLKIRPNIQILDENDNLLLQTDKDRNIVVDEFAPYKIEVRLGNNENEPLSNNVVVSRLLGADIDVEREYDSFMAAYKVVTKQIQLDRLYLVTIVNKDGLKLHEVKFRIQRSNKNLEVINNLTVDTVKPIDTNTEILTELNKEQISSLSAQLQQLELWYDLVDFVKRWYGEKAHAIDVILEQEYDDQYYYMAVTELNVKDKDGNKVDIDPKSDGVQETLITMSDRDNELAVELIELIATNGDYKETEGWYWVADNFYDEKSELSNTYDPYTTYYVDKAPWFTIGQPRIFVLQ